MKAKKVTVILIAVLFVLAVLSAVFFIFTMKKVDVKYSLSEGYDNSEITRTLNSFNGQNLLLIDLKDVEASLEKFPNIKIISIEKKYPSIIKVELAERLPLFNLYDDGKTYTLDKEGFIIKITDGEVENTREIISLKLEGLTLESKVLGKKAICSDDLLFDKCIEMPSEVDLTDCIKELVIKRDATGELKDAVLYTYTGVKITITKADDNGVNKIIEAFKSYDSVTVDFIKSYSEILVYTADDGQIYPEWIS